MSIDQEFGPHRRIGSEIGRMQLALTKVVDRLNELWILFIGMTSHDR
jgi:hypothetical protein